MHSSPGDGGTGGAAASQSPSFTLPMRYMLLGLCGFVLFALDIAGQSAHLAGGKTFSPSVVALTHLLTLGSLLSFTMGAVYQLSTVAFLVPVASERWARLNFWLYAAGAAGLIGSMAAWWRPGLLFFGSLTGISLYLYSGLVIVSVRKSRIRNAMYGFVQSAHVYLILAVTAAWLMILAPAVPALARAGMKLLAAHVILAVGGFFTFLVMGFSSKLLPMFTLSHGFATRRQSWMLAFAHAAIWLLLAGVWAGGRWGLWLGAAAGAAAFLFFLLDIRAILLNRMRKRLEPPIKAVTAAAVAGLAGLLLLAVQPAAGGKGFGWEGVVAFYLLGWITFTVMGYAYKIVPFLIWTRRYSKRVGKEKVPLIAQLIDLDRSKPVLGLYAAGLVLFTVGTAAAFPWGAAGGGALMAAAVLTFCIQLFGVIDVRKIIGEMTADD